MRVWSSLRRTKSTIISWGGLYVFLPDRQCCYHMSPVTRKSVFRFCDKVWHKPASAATEARYSLEISVMASRGIVLSRQRTTTALIRYLDDLLNIDNPCFEGMVNRINLSELQLNKANTSDTEAPSLNLHLSISNGFVSSKIYDKHDDFDFD